MQGNIDRLADSIDVLTKQRDGAQNDLNDAARHYVALEAEKNRLADEAKQLNDRLAKRETACGDNIGIATSGVAASGSGIVIIAATSRYKRAAVDNTPSRGEGQKYGGNVSNRACDRTEGKCDTDLK